MVHLSHTEVLVLQVREMMLEGYVWLHLIAVINISCLCIFCYFLFSFFLVYVCWWVITNTTEEEHSPQNLSMNSSGKFICQTYLLLNSIEMT